MVETEPEPTTIGKPLSPTRSSASQHGPPLDTVKGGYLSTIRLGVAGSPHHSPLPVAESKRIRVHQCLHCCDRCRSYGWFGGWSYNLESIETTKGRYRCRYRCQCRSVCLSLVQFPCLQKERTSTAKPSRTWLADGISSRILHADSMFICPTIPMKPRALCRAPHLGYSRTNFAALYTCR